MNERELRAAWKSAASMESCPEGKSDMERIGGIRSSADPNRAYLIYRDKASHYWYETVFLTNRGELSEYEYIFGHKPSKYKK